MCLGPVIVDVYPVGQAMCSVVRRYNHDETELLFLGLFDCGFGISKGTVMKYKLEEVLKEFMEKRGSAAAVPALDQDGNPSPDSTKMLYYIDVIVLSHADGDHINMIKDIFGSMSVVNMTRRSYIPSLGESAPTDHYFSQLYPVITPEDNNGRYLMRQFDFYLSPKVNQGLDGLKHVGYCTEFGFKRNEFQPNVICDILSENTLKSKIIDCKGIVPTLSMESTLMLFLNDDSSDSVLTINASMTRDSRGKRFKFELSAESSEELPYITNEELADVDSNNLALFYLVIDLEEELRDKKNYHIWTASFRYYNPFIVVPSVDENPSSQWHTKYFNVANDQINKSISQFSLSEVLDSIEEIYRIILWEEGMDMINIEGERRYQDVPFVPKIMKKIMNMKFSDTLQCPFKVMYGALVDVLKGGMPMLLGQSLEESILMPTTKPINNYNIYAAYEDAQKQYKNKDDKVCRVKDLVFGGEYNFGAGTYWGKKPPSPSKKLCYNILARISDRIFCSADTFSDPLQYLTAGIEVHIMPFTLPVNEIDLTGNMPSKYFFNFSGVKQAAINYVMPKASAANATSILSSVVDNFNGDVVIATFPGDATYHTMYYTNHQNVDKFRCSGLMLAPHHGSLSTAEQNKNSGTTTAREYIERLAPKRIVISAGHNNGFGHPHNQIVRMYFAYFKKLANDEGLNYDIDEHVCYYNQTDDSSRIKSRFAFAYTRYPIYSTVGIHLNPTEGIHEMVRSLCYNFINFFSGSQGQCVILLNVMQPNMLEKEPPVKMSEIMNLEAAFAPPRTSFKNSANDDCFMDHDGY